MRSAPVCRDAPSRGGAKYATVTKSGTRANLRGFSRSGRIFAGGNRYGERPSTARKERRNNKQSNMYSLPQVARRGHAVDERSVVCTATATRTPRHHQKAPSRSRRTFLPAKTFFESVPRRREMFSTAGEDGKTDTSSKFNSRISSRFKPRTFGAAVWAGVSEKYARRYRL